jgi:hypothetical protein
MKSTLLFITSFILCFSLSKTNAQSWLWGEMGKGSSDTYAVAADNKGNAYLAGYFIDSISFGSKLLTSLSIDSYLVKYDSSGNIKWISQSKVTSHSGEAFTMFIATDNYGNTYATGWFIDTVVFGSDTLRFVPHNGGYYDCYLVKYDANGNVAWARQAGIPPTFAGRGCDPYSVATDRIGNIYITGSTNGGPVYFGTDTLNSAYGAFFLVKYNSSGNVLWAEQSQGIACGYSVAADSAGNTYVTGALTSAVVSFGLDTLSTKWAPLFLVKYDTGGNVQWAKDANLPSGYSSGASWSVACDRTGNAYITGSVGDTLIFGTDSLKGPLGSYNLFLVKYNSGGNVIWAKQSQGYKDSGYAGGYSIAIDSLNHVYISSGLVGKIVFGTAIFSDTSTLGDASLILQLDTAGNVWCGSARDGGGDDNSTIATDPSGKYVYWGGDVAVTMIFGKDTVIGSNIEPPFIARWQPCSNNTEGMNGISSVYDKVLLFPNPDNGRFTIEQSAEKQDETIEIYNMLGEKIYSTQFEASKAQLSIDISNQPSGIYLYKVISEEDSYVAQGKFVIEK